MSLENLFFAYAAAIVATRLWLWQWPHHAPKIQGFQLHHYMYGLLLVGAYLLIPNAFLLAVGVGLFVDELPLFFIFRGWDWPDDHWKQYSSPTGLLVITAMSVLGYFAIKIII